MFVPPAAITIGPITIYFYSLFILAGITAGYYLAKPAAKKAGITAAELQVSLLYGIIPGVIGARLYHVADRWADYADQPWQALALWHGGLGIFGGLAGGVLGLTLFAYRYRHRLLTVLDVWAPSVLLAQAIGRFGNWTNQEAFGPPTNLPWKIYIDPAHRPDLFPGAQYFHPTFFYEAGLNLLAVAVLVALRPKLMKQPGRVLGLYLISYGLIRFAVEFYRFDTAAIGFVPVAHLISVAMIIGGLCLVIPAKTEPTPQSGRDRR